MFNTAPGRAEYTASAAQTIFTFTFKIYNTSDVKVYLTPTGQTADDTADLLIETTDYTISINGDNGGDVTLTSGTTLNDKITLVRELPTDRGTEYQQNGDLTAEALNEDQDYQTYLILDGTLVKERALVIPDSVQSFDTEIPSPVASKLLLFNDTASGFDLLDPASTSLFKDSFIVDNIAALGSVDPNIYNSVIVRGYYVANDGGGGLFNYDATQSAVNNGGIIINGWIRQYSGVINIRWFGAKGDGITEDTSAIQAAIDVNDNIFFSSGTYRTNKLTLSDNTKIDGEARENTIIKLIDNGAEPVFHIIQLKNIVISNIAVDGNKANYNTSVAAKSCIDILGVIGLTIENCIIKNATGYGVGLQSYEGHSAAEQSDIFINNCSILDNGDGTTFSVDTFDGIDIKESIDVVILNCIVDGNADKGIDVRGKHVNIENCTVSNSSGTSGGIELTGNSGSTSECIGNITNCISYGNQNGIFISDGSLTEYFPIKVNISNCHTYENVYAGIRIIAPDFKHEINIDNTNISGNGSIGVSIEGAKTEANVNNCYIYNNVAGIVNTSEKTSLISNCKILDNASTGIQDATTDGAGLLVTGCFISGSSVNMRPTNDPTTLNPMKLINCASIIGFNTVTRTSTLAINDIDEVYFISGTGNIDDIVGKRKGRTIKLISNDGMALVPTLGNIHTDTGATVNIPANGTAQLTHTGLKWSLH